MTMSTDELRDTFRAYTDAIAHATDAKLSTKTRDVAGESVIRLRKRLDDDYISRIEGAQTTDADMAAAVEARARSASFVAQVNGSARTGIDPAELRSFATPGSPKTDLWVKPGEALRMAPVSAFTTRASDYLTSDTSTVGSGYYFTPTLWQSVVTGILNASGVLEAEPTMVVTDHLRPIQVPVLTADAVATAGTEGSAATAANTEGDAVTLGAYRYDGVFSVSAEMLMASEYDLEALLATFATRAIANKAAAMLALGNGTTQPLGLFTAAAVTVGKQTTVASGPTVDEVLQMTKALPKGYRKTARMVMSDALHTLLLQYKDDNGSYLLRSIEGGGQEFAGKPVYTEPQADQSGMSADEIHAVYGDFAGYYVRTSPMFFRRSDADPLNPEFTFAVWLDARVADANSLVSLKMAS